MWHDGDFAYIRVLFSIKRGMKLFMQLIFTWFISCVRESSVIDPQVDQSYDSSHILNQNNRVNMEFCMTCDVIGQGINQDVKSSDTVCEAGDISMQDCQTLHNYLGNELWSHDFLGHKIESVHRNSGRRIPIKRWRFHSVLNMYT